MGGLIDPRRLAHEKQAAMKPFQFSMRRLFIAVLLFGGAIRLFVLFLGMRDDPSVWPTVCYFGSFILSGAAFGYVEGRPAVWALSGGLWALVLGPFVLHSVNSARE